MQLVLAVGEEEDPCAYGARGGGHVAAERRRLADVVTLDGPAPVDPVARLDTVADRFRLLAVPGVHLLARRDCFLVAGRRPADDALNLQPHSYPGARRIVVRIRAIAPFRI